MRKIYSGGSFGELKSCRLTRRGHTLIGRLIRATAEMEDMATLYLSLLLGIGEDKVALMLGKSPFRNRTALAESIEKATPEKEPIIAQFIKETELIFAVRNAIAHGVLLGSNDSGKYAFLTSNSSGAIDDKISRDVLTFGDDDLEVFAKEAESVATRMETNLGVAALRAERLTRPLRGHRKANPQSRRRVALPTPYQSKAE